MFEKTKIEPLKIETSFDDFFKEIIETIPSPLSHIELRTLAYGIPLCELGEENINLYLAECNKRRVLPFSRTGWRYDSSNNIFLFSDISFENIHNYIPDDTKYIYKKIVSNITAGQFKRKNPHQLNIEIEAPIDKMVTGIRLFQKKNSSLLRNEYIIDYGKILFTGEDYNQHHHESKNTGTIIFKRENSKNILNLYPNENNNTLDNENMMDWFYSIKSKYDNI